MLVNDTKQTATGCVIGFAAADCDSAAELRHTAVAKKILRHAAGTLRHLLAELCRVGKFLTYLANVIHLIEPNRHQL